MEAWFGSQIHEVGVQNGSVCGQVLDPIGPEDLFVDGGGIADVGVLNPAILRAGDGHSERAGGEAIGRGAVSERVAP
jgi:hypothetical protein